MNESIENFSRKVENIKKEQREIIELKYNIWNKKSPYGLNEWK